MSVNLKSKKPHKIDENEVKWIKDNLCNDDSDLTDGSSPRPPDHGEVVFKGATRRSKGKFVRLSDKTDPSKVYELMTKIWGLDVPRLLVSVTGGAKSFNMDPKLKHLFAAGLLKVAQTPGAWIITGGTNTGVMKHVGEALQGATKACIGIATWGIVQNREMLMSDSLHQPNGGKYFYSIASSLVETGAFLDHNHTHFLLADNGSVKKYGVEIPFRSALEIHIMKKAQKSQDVPSVLLVLEGGPGTLGTVVGAIKGEQPVVIVKDSGRAADCIAYGLEAMQADELDKYSSENPHPSILQFVKTTFSEITKHDEIRKLYNQVIECVSKRDVFTVFQMDGGAGVDEAILTALLNSRSTSPASQLQLTLLWDRSDLARTKILSQPHPWKESKLQAMMIMALAMNRVDFVRLLISYSISIPSLLNNARLEFLYGYRSLTSSSTLKFEFEPNQYTCPKKEEKVMKLLCNFEKVEISSCALRREDIVKCVNRLCGCFVKQGSEEFIENLDSSRSASNGIEMDSANQTFKYPFRELFIWAVCNNMPEMAMYLMELEEEGMAKAFIGGAISEALGERANSCDLGEELEANFNDNAMGFKKLALDLLDECFKTDVKSTESLLTNECVQFPQQTLLGLAVASEHKEFVSHSSVQIFLNDVWSGAIKQRDITGKAILLGLLFPPYICYGFQFRTKPEIQKMARADDYDEESVEVDKETGKGNESLAIEDNGNNQGDTITEHSRRLVEDKQPDYQSTAQTAKLQPAYLRTFQKELELPWYLKLNEFYFKVPVTKFFTNLIAYLIFLVLFSYVVILKKSDTMPDIAEWVLISFVVSLTFEEIYEYTQGDSTTFIGKIIDWGSNKWNLMDALAIVLFFVSLGLRVNKSTQAIGNLFYALDAGLWILRLLNVFYAHRILGPYVVMIYRMFIDMMYFLVILLVFLLAYGVSTTAILIPQDLGWDMLRDSFFHPYFNIYGELFIDRDPENNATTRFGTAHTNDYAEPIAWCLLGSYLLIANVLLLNLLIAIFGNTFQEVQENSATIWKFERYNLIIEYAKRPPLVPPLMLLCHIYYVARWLIRRCSQCGHEDATGSGLRNELQSNLNDEERDALIEFENGCMTSFIRNKRQPWTTQREEEVAKSLLNKVEDLSSMVVSLEKRLKNMAART